MKKDQQFQKLPRKILLYIAQFLYIEDIICLSNTCRRLKRILPLWLIRGPDIEDRGLKTWKSWIPEPYLETQPLESHVFMVTISMYWQDQGWGLQKGKIWMQLVRPRTKKKPPKIVCENKDLFGSVPHKEEFIIRILTIKDPIISLAQAGDYFRIMKNVGGGSWRQLIVRKFKIVVASENKTLHWA